MRTCWQRMANYSGKAMKTAKKSLPCNVRRRELAEKRELEEKLKCAEQKREAAFCEVRW